MTSAIWMSNRANASNGSKQLEDIIVVPRGFKKLASKGLSDIFSKEKIQGPI
jgi:hypothetical protein